MRARFRAVAAPRAVVLAPGSSVFLHPGRRPGHRDDHRLGKSSRCERTIYGGSVPFLVWPSHSGFVLGAGLRAPKTQQFGGPRCAPSGSLLAYRLPLLLLSPAEPTFRNGSDPLHLEPVADLQRSPCGSVHAPLSIDQFRHRPLTVWEDGSFSVSVEPGGSIFQLSRNEFEFRRLVRSRVEFAVAASDRDCRRLERGRRVECAVGACANARFPRPLHVTADLLTACVHYVRSNRSRAPRCGIHVRAYVVSVLQRQNVHRAAPARTLRRGTPPARSAIPEAHRKHSGSLMDGRRKWELSVCQREDYERFRLHAGGDLQRGRATLVRAHPSGGLRARAQGLRPTVFGESRL